MSSKENVTTRNIKLGKGKYTVEVVVEPLIKLVGKLKDKSSKIICSQNKWLKDTQNNWLSAMISKTSTCEGRRVQTQAI